MLKVAGALGALLTLALTTTSAAADSLLTGAIRDQLGIAVHGARVTARDRGGVDVGTATVFEDGTFVLDAPASAVTLAITCDYCRTVRRVLDAGPTPLIVIVERFADVTQRGPSPADLRVLPYRSAADTASLVPFTVVDSGRVSDRALDAYGATLVNGLPFYSPADGDNYSRLIPAHAVAALAESAPLAAPLYGGYADAGIYDLRLNDPDIAPSRLDAGTGFDLIARAQTTSAAAISGVSNGDGGRREVAAASIALPLAGGRLAFMALDMADDFSAATGAGIGYSTDSRRYTTSVSLNATRAGDAGLVTGDARVRNHGPLGLEFGIRATRATGTVDGKVSAQADSALFADAARVTGTSTLTAAIALDRGSDAGSGASTHTAALVGSLGADIRLSANWRAHSGLGSNLRIPTFATASAVAPDEAAANRSLLFEQSITYGDLRRLQISGVAYTERTTGTPTTHVNGIGIDAGWQIVPLLSLRSWVLHANRLTDMLGTVYPGAPSSHDALAPKLIWLTYNNALRLDLLVRSGALEGDVRVPLGAAYALAVGTAKYNGARTTSLGVTWR